MKQKRSGRHSETVVVAVKVRIRYGSARGRNEAVKAAKNVEIDWDGDAPSDRGGNTGWSAKKIGKPSILKLVKRPG